MASSLTISLDEWSKALLEVGARKGWASTPAKPEWRDNIPTKLSHSFSVADAAINLLELIDPYAEENRKIVLFTASFLHDMGKEKTYKAPKKHEMYPAINVEDFKAFVNEALNLYGKTVNKELVEEILDSYSIAVHGAPTSMAEGVAKGILHAKAVQLSKILNIADSVISAVENHDIDSAVARLKNLDIQSSVAIFFRVRGFSSQLVAESVIKAHINKGWKLLCFTPSTLLFTASNDKSKPTYEDIRRELLSGLRELVSKSDIYRLVVGVFGQTPWRFVREIMPLIDDHEPIWELIFRRGEGFAERVLKKRDLPKEVRILEESEFGFFLQVSLALIYLFRLPEAFSQELAAYAEVKTKRDQKDQLVHTLVEVLDLHNQTLASKLASFTWTAPIPKKIELAKEFVESIQEADEKLHEMMKIKNFKQATVFLRKKFSDASRSLVKLTHLEGGLDHLAGAILADMVLGLNGMEVKELAEEDLKCYAGKEKSGTPLCPICGESATREAIASIIGGGSESFSNFLAGGTAIDAKNKVRICDGCYLEGLLRLVFSRGGDVNFIVFPQAVGSVRLAEEVEDRLLDNPLQLLASLRERKLPTQIRVGKQTLRNILEIAFGSEPAERDQRVKDAIADLLQDGEQFNFDVAVDLLEKHLSGAPLKNHEKAMAERLNHEVKRAMIRFNPHYFPQYVLLHGVRVKSADDNDTEFSLKVLTVGLLLSKSLYGSTVAQVGLTPIMDFNVRGVTRVLATSTVRSLPLPIEHDNWIRYDHLEKLLRGLMAAQCLVVADSRGRKKGFSLLDVITTPPAVIFDRLLKRAGVSRVTLLTWLEDVRKMLTERR